MRALITPRFAQQIEVWRSFSSEGQFPNGDPARPKMMGDKSVVNGIF
jgi:hypothetical protein